MTSSSLPYFECQQKSGQILRFLIDTGSSKNYIQPGLAKKTIPNETSFLARSIAGDVKIQEHTFINLFNLEDKHKFFIMPTLQSFHGILGNDSLKELDAIIHTNKNYMQIKNNKKVKIKQLISKSVNSIDIRDEHMTQQQKHSIKNTVNKFPKLFTEPDEKLTYTTKVFGEIRTSSDEPVYSKSYPYPNSLKNEVENQVRQMLNDGIIRPSRSPYNSPVWVVEKKSDSKGNKQYRMVIDYRKLNTVTIPDRYPIPEISEVISQLGNCKYFSVLDLKSGFHQIPLKEKDKEKTAFAINNAKYEFNRLPFGLRNAPSIFQRALDDILREYIGKICYVYIDDIIIFSESEQDHSQHIELIFKALENANMKVQLDKCHFYQEEVEFLGFIISPQGIKTNPKKIEAVANFPTPKTIKDLRAFLGLSGYYRRFVQDYAKIAKPLTTLLRGEEGRISKKQSAKIPINLNTEALEAFRKLKNSLISKDTLLSYPNYNECFELTTDASNYAIGAVLSQKDKPISFISRTLNKAEEHYATNEKEMLAIIWALNSFRNYLYGSRKVIIRTDHQPLTYAMSNKNNNSKMKRWKAILEEYNYELLYKPGKSNVVADALSRIPLQSQVNSMSTMTHSDDSSGQNLIRSVEAPINVFKNQILIKVGPTTPHKFQIIFPTYHRHTIIEPNYTTQNLIEILKKNLNPSVINGIKTSEPIMGKIQEVYSDHFSRYRIRFTRHQVEDVVNEEQQQGIIIETHKRAHRNTKENKIQILEKYYFPGMNNKIKKVVKQCTVCKLNKYDRHPTNPELKETPIPTHPGHTLHIDIYKTENNLVLTAIDKFSKYAQGKVVKSRAIEDIKEPLRQLLFLFGVPRVIVVDNEKSLNSSSINFMVEDQLGIQIFRSPPYKSSVNGQIERFHSTLSEIMRCLKSDGTHRSFIELLDRSIYEYNSSIHSTTGKKPIEIFFGRNSNIDPEQYEKARQDNIQRLKEKQYNDIKYHNKNRLPIITYNPGDTVYVKIHSRLGSKISPRYKQETVKENRTTTILTESNRVVHKSNIKN